MRATNEPTSRRWLWFFFFCLLPLGILLVWAGGGWAGGNWILLALFLLCPILVFWMMRDGGDRSAGQHWNSSARKPEGEESEDLSRR